VKRKPASGRQTEIADAILRVAGREVGVTSGALFRHFRSRTAMLNEAAERAVALLETTFPAPGLPPLERLREFVAARSRLAAEHGAIPQLVFSEQFGKALPPKGARAVRAVVLRTREFVVEALREAGARAEVRRDIPAEELALTVMGTIFAGALFGALVDDGHGKPRPRAETAWNHLLCLIRSPEPAAASPSTIEGVRA